MAKSTPVKLSNIAKAWAKKKDEAKKGGDFIPVEDGMFVMQIVKAEIADYGEKRKCRTQWYVLESDIEKERGLICNGFRGLETEDHLMWLQRELLAMGVDLDEQQVEDEDDILAIYHELIEARHCQRMQVKTNKEGYSNLKFKKPAEVDEDDTIDLDEVFKESATAQASKDDDDDDDDKDGGDEALAEGVAVGWTSKAGKALTGVVQGEDDDGGVLVKIDGKDRVVTKDREQLTVILPESKDDEDEDDPATGAVVGDPDPDEPSDDESPYASMKKKALKALCDERDIIVKRSEQGDKEALIRLLTEADEKEVDGGDDTEIEEGDAVICTIKGKECPGTVKSVDENEKTAKVKLDSGKTKVVPFADVAFEVDDD